MVLAIGELPKTQQNASEQKPNNGVPQPVLETPQNLIQLQKMLDDINKEAILAKEAAKSVAKGSSDTISVNKKTLTAEQIKKMDLAKQAVDKTIKFFQANPEVISAKLTEGNAVVMRKLLDAVKADPTKVNPDTSPYLYEIFRKAVNNEIKNPLDAVNKDDLTYLRAADSILYGKVVDSLADAAKQQGKAEDEINKFKTGAAVVEIKATTTLNSEVEPKNLQEAYDKVMLDAKRNSRGTKEGDLLQVAQFFSSDGVEDELKEVFALFDKKYFKEYARDTIARLKREAEVDSRFGGDAVLIAKAVSENFENEIVLKFSKLFSKVDVSRSNELFEENTKAGFMNSIESAFEAMKRHFDQTAQDIERDEAAERLTKEDFGITFYGAHSEEFYNPVYKKDKYVNEKRTVPSAVRKEVSIGAFMRSISEKINRDVDTRSYLHNLGVIFQRGAGEKGFYGQLAGYAERFKAVDIDTISLLPDSDMFLDAARLYTKFLEEEMARNNWIHQPNMFAEDFLNIRTGIIEEVYNVLKAKYPHYAKGIRAEEGKEGKEPQEWRLRRAMSMGLGIARGIHLSEVEIAAWADPHVDMVNGSPKFTSYYTNDNAALTALNPLHHYLRWQAENILRGPLVFLPVTGFDVKMGRVWNHRDLWDQAEQFYQSFTDGKAALKREKEGVRLFIDMLPNISHVGGIIYRSGWRNENAIDGWLRFKTKDTTRGTELVGMDVENSFKAIENIGFEPMMYFINSKIDDNFLYKSTDKEVADSRKRLYGHLYRKYIKPLNPDGSIDVLPTDATDDVKKKFNEKYEGEAEKYINELMHDHDVEHEVDHQIQHGSITKANRADGLKKEAHKVFLYRVLAGTLRNRAPTKLIKLERDRLSKDGTRVWAKTLQKFMQRGMGKEEDFDRALKDIMIAESDLRKNISQLMRDHHNGKPPRDATLHDFAHGDQYVLTEGKIKALLEQLYKDESEPDRKKRVDTALNTFKLLTEDYSNNTAHLNEFADKIRHRTRHLPFSIASDETDTFFLGFRGAGGSILARALRDTNHADNDVFKQINTFIEALPQVALDSKHSVAPLVKSLHTILHTLEGMHGHYAYEVVHHMAALAIAYFKKDTAARNIFTGAFRLGKYNSLAARFAHRTAGVWEWDVKDIDHFIFELERDRMMPKDPWELKQDPSKREPVYLNILGKKIKVGMKETPRSIDIHYYGKTLREQFGATYGHMALEIVNKYVPLFVLFLLWQFMNKSLKEATGGGGGGGGGHH